MLTSQEKKIEAIERMKLLKLHENAINDFWTFDKVNVSENGGFLYWLNNKQQMVVNKFESDFNALVYHALYNIVYGDEHLALLYVSNNSDDWEKDREDLQNGFPMAYVKNLSCDICSEFGYIGVESNIGGLRRTA